MTACVRELPRGIRFVRTDLFITNFGYYVRLATPRMAGQMGPNKTAESGRIERWKMKQIYGGARARNSNTQVHQKQKQSQSNTQVNCEFVAYFLLK